MRVAVENFMADDSKNKRQQHLINIIKNTKDHHPNFTVFLGAGASVTSGIKSAQKMIDDS